MFFLYFLAFIFGVSCTVKAEQESVLVTGGAGYVGSHIAYVLAQKGYSVIIIDKAVHTRHPWATYIEADIANESVLDEIFTKNKIEAVFHCAAYAIVSESITHPLKFYQNNISNTLTLLNSMLKNNVKRIIFASSRSVYGNAQFSPITEDHPKNPLSPYARTKVMTEMILEDLHNANGLEYVALRFVNAVGAYPEVGLGEDHQPETHVWPLLMQAARTNGEFTIYGNDHKTYDGTCVRSYIHVMDIATANYLAFEYLKNGGKSDIFQLGSPVTLSIQEMVDAVAHFYKKPIKTVILRKRPADSPELISDCSKATRILGWHPEYSTLEHILQSMDTFMNMQDTKTA